MKFIRYLASPVSKKSEKNIRQGRWSTGAAEKMGLWTKQTGSEPCLHHSLPLDSEPQFPHLSVGAIMISTP